MLKFRHIRALLEVAETQRITRAAVNLNVSQPAVSRLLSALEETLGVSLFVRTHEKMVPSEYGAVLIDGARRALKHLIEAEQEIRPISNYGRAIAQPLSRAAADHELLAAIYVAKYGTVQLAADELSVSQTAIKRSLSALENRINRKLFERSARLMIPTPAGEILVRRAQLAFSEIRQAKEELAFVLGDRRGNLRLRVGALPLSRVHLVPLAVSRVAEEIPEIAVTIVDGAYDNLLRELASGELDVIVGTIRESAAASSDVVSEKLFDDSLIVVARAGHPFFSLPRISTRDLAHAKWIVPRQGVPMRSQFEQMLKRARLELPGDAIEVDSFIAIRSLLFATDWLAVVSRTQIYHDEAQGVLRQLALPFATIKRPVGITLRKDYSPSRCMEIFIRHMRSIAADLTQ